MDIEYLKENFKKCFIEDDAFRALEQTVEFWKGILEQPVPDCFSKNPLCVNSLFHHLEGDSACLKMCLIGFITKKTLCAGIGVREFSTDLRDGKNAEQSRDIVIANLETILQLTQEQMKLQNKC